MKIKSQIYADNKKPKRAHLELRCQQRKPSTVFFSDEFSMFVWRPSGVLSENGELGQV